MNKSDITLSSDILLIIECCKEEPSLTNIIQYSNSIYNWENFISVSLRNGILPLVYMKLNSLKELNIPPEILVEMRSLYFDIAKKNMLLSSELINLSRLFSENNIKVLFFKGPTLSSEVYGNITLRQYADLDLLIKKEDLILASNLLISIGMKSDININYLENEYLKSTANDFSFFSKNNTHFELHWNLFRQLFNNKTNSIDIWNNLKEINLNKNKINVLKNEYLFLYLCIHGSKHLWERIEWIVDINKFIKKENLDWELVLELSSDLKSNNMLFLGLSLSHTLFKTKLPKNIQIELQNTKIKNLENKVLNMYSKNIYLEEGNLFHIILKFKIITQMKENNFEKVKYFISSIFKPTQYDIYFIKVEKFPLFFYYLVRPYRFLYNLLFSKN